MAMNMNFLIVACLLAESFAAGPKTEYQQRRSAPILSKVQNMKIATKLSEAGLLTGAEKAGIFSKLEKGGAFSTAEKLLPITDQIGFLQFLEDTANTPSGDLVARGVGLVLLGPAYLAALKTGYLPDAIEDVNQLIPGVVFTGTTGVGVLTLALSNLVGQLEAADAPPKNTLPIFGRLGEIKLATAVSKTGLLSSAEKAGVFSSLEKSGAFSAAEKALPIADKVGALKAAENFLNTNSGDLFQGGAALVLFGPIAGLTMAGLQGIIPGDGGVQDLLVLLGVTGLWSGSGLVFIAASLVADAIQNGEPLKVDGPLFKVSPKTAKATPKLAQATPKAATFTVFDPKAANAKAPKAPPRQRVNTKPDFVLPRQGVKARALPEAPAPQFLNRGFNSYRQSPFMSSSIRGAQAQAPQVRGPFLAQTSSADAMSIPAVALMGVFAGSAIAFALQRFRTVAPQCRNEDLLQRISQ